MYVRTEGAYGVNEGILSSAIAALTFALFSVQPLTIVGGEFPPISSTCFLGHSPEILIALP